MSLLLSLHQQALWHLIHYKLSGRHGSHGLTCSKSEKAKPRISENFDFTFHFSRKTAPRSKSKLQGVGTGGIVNCMELNLYITFVPGKQVTLHETVLLLLTMIAETVGKIPPDNIASRDIKR